MSSLPIYWHHDMPIFSLPTLIPGYCSRYIKLFYTVYYIISYYIILFTLKNGIHERSLHHALIYQNSPDTKRCIIYTNTDKLVTMMYLLSPEFISVKWEISLELLQFSLFQPNAIISARETALMTSKKRARFHFWSAV